MQKKKIQNLPSRKQEHECINEGEEHRGADQEGTRLTDRGRQRAEHRKDLQDKRHKRAWRELKGHMRAWKKQNMRHGT